MKKIISVLLLSLIIFGAQAQLINSKWKTTLQLDEATDVVFNFSADILNVTYATDSSNILEASKYTLKDTVLTLRKLFGQSECDTTAIGIYSCIINGNEMQLTLISDDCSNRADIIKDIKLNKSENSFT